MQVWSHHLGVAQRLKGERRALLLNVRPVDAAEWHVELCKLLDEESDLMEVERMGRLVEASPPRWRLHWRFAGWTASSAV